MMEEKSQGNSITRQPLENQPIRKDGRPQYLLELEGRWIKWTDIDDPDILEALDYLSGDLFFEMRKLTSQSCLTNEESERRLIRKLTGVLGIQNDRDKLRDIGQAIIGIMNEEKCNLKMLIDKSWRDIVDKQKVGIDKVCIVVTKHVFDKIKENINEKKEQRKTSTQKKRIGNNKQSSAEMGGL